MVDLNKQKSLFFMELFLYLIFLDLDKMDIYRDKALIFPCFKIPKHKKFGPTFCFVSLLLVGTFP